MRIFIFCATAAIGKGGMEKVAIELAGSLAVEHSVAFGYFEREGSSKPAYPINDSVLLAPWNKESISRDLYKKTILSFVPNVFLYFNVGPQSIQILSLLYGEDVPIIIHEGSNPERIISNNWVSRRQPSKYMAAWERELIYSQASAIRFTMPEYKSSLPTCIRHLARAFPNAFETPEKQAALHAKKIINIGGLKTNKNIFPLLEACKLVFEQYPDWELNVFSARNQGPAGIEYAEKVSEYIERNKLGRNVRLRGETNDIYDEYLGSSVHVITSLAEGLSNAVSEAMCCGVPSIGVKDVPGVDGLIRDHENGILVDRDNIANGLYIALIELIKNQELRNRLGSQARSDAKMFDPERIREEWKSILMAAVGRPNVKNSEVFKQRLIPLGPGPHHVVTGGRKWFRT